MSNRLRLWLVFTLALVATVACVRPEAADPIDDKVRAVLDSMRYRWRDMNVPEEDGRILHDLVVKIRATRALEVGTSTGHSGIWIAWALSKTGGKLITIEIDPERHREAVGHFTKAGLGPFVDARLGDAHELVPRLEGPFDFVFIDADKEWYVNYAKALLPKLAPGACLTAHNVREASSGRRGRYGRGSNGEFFEFMKAQPGFETLVHPESRGGVSVSCRREAD